ncbi:MAG: hypothetical protein V1694_00675 [Candidatus Eisenbacteria bacterium]
MRQEAILVRELRPEDDLAAVLRLCKDFFAEYEGHHKEFFDTAAGARISRGPRRSLAAASRRLLWREP